MRKVMLILLVCAALFSLDGRAQGRGVKIGFIDMEYILQNVPDYAQAKNELELKAQKWKQEIEVKRGEINTMKDALKTERVLLTKELIEEREEEIAFQEKELLDYQQKRFGPTGDLVTQKSVLIKPIQDQVFTSAQDIAEAKKYDFIFDKSSDLTMLFAAKRFDISDQVIRSLTRASKREQMSKKQLKAEEAREAKEDMVDENPALAERQKILDEKKAAREKLMEDRKLAADARKAAAEEKRAQLKAEREAKKNGTTVASPEKPAAASGETPVEGAVENQSTTTSNAKTEAADARKAAQEERKRILEERRQKALETREANKKAKLDQRKGTQTANDSVPTPPTN